MKLRMRKWSSCPQLFDMNILPRHTYNYSSQLTNITLKRQRKISTSTRPMRDNRNIGSFFIRCILMPKTSNSYYLCFIMVWQTFGAVMLLPLLYFLYRKEFLNDYELTMLLSSSFLAVMMGVGGWVGQLGYLLGVGYHNLNIFLAARSTQLFRHSQQAGRFNRIIQICFTFNANELKLLVYMVYFWITVKITSLKSLSYDMGGGNFTSVIDGWNCTLNEFWAIYLIWLILAGLSACACLFLINYDDLSDNLYKKYLLKYKLSFDLLCLFFIFVYNYWANSSSTSLQDCKVLYERGSWARCIWFWSLPASTVVFFYRKQGCFQEVTSDRTQNMNELQKQLNAMQIDFQMNSRQVHKYQHEKRLYQ